MMSLIPLLAEMASLNPLGPGPAVDRSTGLVFRDLLLILLVGGVLALLLFLGARQYVKSKQRRRRPHAHSHNSQPTAGSPADLDQDELRNGDEETDDDQVGSAAEPGRRRRRRRRRRQREHRPRNPTLAQTGGLPPPKAPSPGPSGS